MDLGALVEKLADIPGVVGATLGGSRAVGRQRPDSDWDVGLYYRGRLDANDVRALGFEGTVVDPGDWGRLVDGGAWLTIEGERVDILFETSISCPTGSRRPQPIASTSTPSMDTWRAWPPTSWQENWRCVGCSTGSCHDRPSRMR